MVSMLGPDYGAMPYATFPGGGPSQMPSYGTSAVMPSAAQVAQAANANKKKGWAIQNVAETINPAAYQSPALQGFAAQLGEWGQNAATTGANLGLSLNQGAQGMGSQELATLLGYGNQGASNINDAALLGVGGINTAAQGFGNAAQMFGNRTLQQFNADPASRAAQLNYMNQLGAIGNGTQQGLGQVLLKQSGDMAAQQAMRAAGMAATNRPGEAMREGMQAGTQAQLEAGAQAAAMGAQQQMQALGMAGDLSSAMRQGDLSQAGLGLQSYLGQTGLTQQGILAALSGQLQGATSAGQLGLSGAVDAGQLQLAGAQAGIGAQNQMAALGDQMQMQGTLGGLDLSRQGMGMQGNALGALYQGQMAGAAANQAAQQRFQELQTQMWLARQGANSSLINSLIGGIAGLGGAGMKAAANVA